MRLNRTAAVLALSFICIAGVSAPVRAQVATAPRWAPAAQASIHPGVQTVSEVGQCTANFVFYDSSDIYIGQAAHCTSTGSVNDTNGCETEVLPLGTQVEVGGASIMGQVVYNSWNTMREVGERSEDACFGNDFALVKLDSADHAKINPSIPLWGGPVGLDPDSGGGESLYSYGNSVLRAGFSPLSRQFGFAVGQGNSGWTHDAYMITPGIPGDSGAAYLGSNGGALGVLSTFSLTLSNQISDLSRALGYMKLHTDLDGVQLANGTEPFSPLF